MDVDEFRPDGDDDAVAGGHPCVLVRQLSGIAHAHPFDELGRAELGAGQALVFDDGEDDRMDFVVHGSRRAEPNRRYCSVTVRVIRIANGRPSVLLGRAGGRHSYRGSRYGVTHPHRAEGSNVAKISFFIFSRWSNVERRKTSSFCNTSSLPTVVLSTLAMVL